MSNIFKSNSRFSTLIDTHEQKKDSKREPKKETKSNEKMEPEERLNIFKFEKPLRREYGYTDFSDRGRELYRFQIEAQINRRKELAEREKELAEREKERIKQESLKSENFLNLYR